MPRMSLASIVLYRLWIIFVQHDLILLLILLYRMLDRLVLGIVPICLFLVYNTLCICNIVAITIPFSSPFAFSISLSPYLFLSVFVM